MEAARKIGTNFSWKPLTVIPEKTSPSATYIQGDDAESFLAEFNATAIEQYGDASAKVTVLTYDPKSRTVRGSNPFAVAHVDSLLKSQGIRVATMVDLEKVLTTNAFDLRGEFQYEDTALVLRTSGGPNPYLANNLTEQVKARGIEVGNVPLLVQLRGLELINDSGSNHGLAFKLSDESQIVQAPYLVEGNNLRRFNKLDENGAPVFVNDGKRKLFTNDNDLRRLFLNNGLYIDSYNNLNYSHEGGKVVLVSGIKVD